jgi:hypothetical protein
MIAWIPVSGSSVVSAEAYDADLQRIYVRYHSGDEWWYGECPRRVWEAFTAPGQSRGRYLNSVLKQKPGARVG